MLKKYLPIGSVVLLKNGTKKVMIMGYQIKNGETNKVYDYMCCLYPEGLIDLKEFITFNHDDIEEILYLGYMTDEYTILDGKLKTNKGFNNE